MKYFCKYLFLMKNAPIGCVLSRILMNKLMSLQHSCAVSRMQVNFVFNGNVLKFKLSKNKTERESKSLRILTQDWVCSFDKKKKNCTSTLLLLLFLSILR